MDSTNTSILNEFEDFCGSEVWNWNLTWYPANNSLPDITPCMENVGLIWVPCALLWLQLFPYLYILKLHSGVTLVQPLNKLSATKTVIPLLVAIVHLYQLFSTELTSIKIVSKMLAAVTSILAAVLPQVYRKHGQYRSGPLWMYWLAAGIAALFHTYLAFKRFYQDSVGESNDCIISSVMSFLHLLAFFFSSISDAGTEIKKYYKKQSPEVVASFPSMLTFHWIQPVLSAGYRKKKEGTGLERSDLYELHPIDRVKNFFPPFEKEFLEKAAIWRKKHPIKVSESVTSNGNIQESDESTPLIAKSSDASSTTSNSSKKKTPKGFSLASIIFKHWLPVLLSSWVLRMLLTAMGFIDPLIQGWLITFMDSQLTNDVEPLWKGLTLCFVALGISITCAIFRGICRYLEFKAFIRIYSTLMISIYKKALTMNGTAKQETTTGEIVNLMSIDTDRTTALIYEAYVYFYVPVQCTIALYMLYQLLGNAAFAALGIIAISAPLTIFITRFTQRLRKYALEIKDQRIKVMNETLSAIKIIKLYAWEPSFQRRICELREKETKAQRKLNWLNSTFWCIYCIIPILVTVVVFSIYTSTTPDHVLTPSVAFVSLTLIDILRDGMNHIPHSISFVVECLVSSRRIVEFFKTEDLDEANVIVDQSAAHAVGIRSGHFSHLPDQPKVLHDINLQVRVGSLTSIVGTVGAGKSSLLAAIIGDLHKHEGTVKVKGSIALVAQQAFILNGTVRENILFGSSYEPDRYNRVVEACALTRDLEIFIEGDMTMIGEKGINLSGGQKQRISLARAVYNDADIYLLDDPLSAVDAHVGKHIFDKVIGPKGLLKNKTRLMVTHGIHWLPLVEEVYVLKKGRIGEHGDYRSLLNHNGEFSQFLKEYFLKKEDGNKTDDEDDAECDEMQKKLLKKLKSVTDGNSEDELHELAQDGEQTSPRSPRVLPAQENKKDEQPKKDKNVYDEEEEVATGGVRIFFQCLLAVTLHSIYVADFLQVTWAVYMAYLRAIGLNKVVVLLGIILMSATSVTFSSVWLSVWTDDPVFKNSTVSNEVKEEKMEMYLGVFTALGVVGVGLLTLYVAGTAHCFYIASVNIHRKLLDNILRAKMVFFDIKPLGMILNRFSKDIDGIDNEVGWSLMSVVDTSMDVFTALAGIVYATNIMIIPVVVIVVCYFFLQRYFICTARQGRRLRSKATSPIYAHFSETLAGTQTIRAYRQQERFINTNIKFVEECSIYRYINRFVNAWLVIRMGVMAGLLIFLSASFCVISTQIPFLANLMTPSLAGLVLSLTFKVTGSLSGFVWILAWAETAIVSMERIKEYSEVEREAAWDGPSHPPIDWPSAGEVEIDSYATRYREGLNLVVKDLTLRVKAKEKIGIVGRTGAGKSTLTLSLFRLLEAAEGKIMIDGIDISTLGLHDVRNRITILPQDPVLFAGSIRENLDPFSECSDERLWQVLEQCQLKEFVMEKPEKLSTDCGEGGQNLSVGQRQLICLARSLLRKTRILIMDEATSAVDLKTDDFIQKTVKEEFADCTILTIAHRLNTIMDSDRILVMSEGRAAEFDSPQNLLADTSSIFYGMAKEASIV